MRLTNPIPTLQLAVGPTILISGVGMMLLSMTNRFGRVIDRSRQLTHERLALLAARMIGNNITQTAWRADNPWNNRAHANRDTT